MVYTTVQDYGYIPMARIMHELMYKGTIDGTIAYYKKQPAVLPAGRHMILFDSDSDHY